MKLPSSTWVLALLATALLAVSPARSQTGKPAAGSPEAKPFRIDRFQSSIDAFISSDKASPPPKEGILFIGSSIFRQWTSVTTDFAPLPVFNRAFGGSRTIEVLHYADVIVLPYHPKLIVYYCGSNDINADVHPPEILKNFRAFAERVHKELPGTKIIYASILKAPQKVDRWDWVEDANRQISQYCAQEPYLRFVDLNPAVLRTEGTARMELYKSDKLHYLAPAYVGFTAILKPVVSALWAEEKRGNTP